MIPLLPDRCYEFLEIEGGRDPYPLLVAPITFLHYLETKAEGRLLQFQTISGDKSGHHPCRVLAAKRSDLSDRIIIGQCPLNIALMFVPADRILRLPDDCT